VKYWLSAHNGVVGVAGSNPVVPTLFLERYFYVGFCLGGDGMGYIKVID